MSYPEIRLQVLTRIWPELGSYERGISEQVEIDAKYAVYMQRQTLAVSTLKRDEGVRLGLDFNYDLIPGLSNEVRAKLKYAMPESLGQAGRIEGITPAALTLILAWIKKNPETSTSISVRGN